jgi:CP family cyanate transporter-like MFS transporter
MKRLDPALLVVLGGVCAALHVGKLPPAIPVLGDAMGISLLQAGFLLSIVQLAGMALGLAAGLAADTLGGKRTMVAGLAVLSLASLLGGWATGASGLLALRAVEGAGFLLATMPAPALVRRLVEPRRMSAVLGLWGAYMPLGTALALLGGPAFMAWAGWRCWWWLLGGLSLVMAVWLARALPPDAVSAAASRHGWAGRLRQTLASRGPWLVAMCFAMYSGQWLAVIGFLPAIGAGMDLPPGWLGPATALAAAVNIAGNVGGGRLLQRGVPPTVLLVAGFAAMGLGAFVAFSGPMGAPAGVRYTGVLLFSMLGGMIPATLFSLAVRLAPGEGAVSTTVGWVQQWSSLGQFAGPPLVAWVATRVGGWELSWMVTGACAAAGCVLAALLARSGAGSGQPGA